MSSTEKKEEKKEPKSFWETLPGILTALAAFVTAIGSCLTIIVSWPRPNVFFPSTATPIMTTSETRIPPTFAPTLVPPMPVSPTNTATPPSIALPLVLYDSFDSVEKGWWVGDDRIGESCQVAAGKYRCELKPNTAYAHWHWLDQLLAMEFYLAVDARHVSGGTLSDSGLVFQHVENNHYLFIIRDDQLFIGLYRSEVVVPLIDWTKSAAIRSDQTNRLSIRATGSHYVFLINDLQVWEIDDNRLSKGRAGVFYSSITKNEPAIFEFDNYELRQR